MPEDQHRNQKPANDKQSDKSRRGLAAGEKEIQKSATAKDDPIPKSKPEDRKKGRSTYEGF